MTHQFCWLNLSEQHRKECIGQQLASKACSRYSWDTAGPLLEFWKDHIHPCIEKILRENYSVLYRKGGVHVPIACRFLLISQTQEASSAVPTIVFRSISKSAAQRAKRLLLAHDLYVRLATGLEIRCEKISVQLCGGDTPEESSEQSMNAGITTVSNPDNQPTGPHPDSVPTEDRDKLTTQNRTHSSHKSIIPEGIKSSGRQCDACWRRKVRCKPGIPKCSACTQSQLECSFKLTPQERSMLKPEWGRQQLRGATTISLLRDKWDHHEDDKIEKLKSIASVNQFLNPQYARETEKSHFETQPFEYAANEAERPFVKREQHTEDAQQSAKLVHTNRSQEHDKQNEFVAGHIDSEQSDIKEEQTLFVRCGAPVRILPRTFNYPNTDRTQSACCMCIIEICGKLYGILPAHSLRPQPSSTYVEEHEDSSSDGEASSDYGLTKSDTTTSYHSQSSSSTLSSSSSFPPLQIPSTLQDAVGFCQYAVYLDETKMSPSSWAAVKKTPPSLFLGYVHNDGPFEFQDDLAGLSSGLDYLLFQIENDTVYVDNSVMKPDGLPLRLGNFADPTVAGDHDAFMTSQTGILGPFQISKTPGIMTIPGIASPQHVLEMDHTLNPGESGSMVFNNSGYVLGMAVATCPAIGVTYMISAADIFGDILRSMKPHIRPKYPSHTHILFSQTFDPEKLEQTSEIFEGYTLEHHDGVLTLPHRFDPKEDLLCPFQILDCDETFWDVRVFKMHVFSHFRGHPLPTFAKCFLCDKSYTQTPEDDDVRAWNNMLEHMVNEHFRGDQRFATMRPDFALMRWMYSRKIISDHHFKRIQLLQPLVFTTIPNDAHQRATSAAAEPRRHIESFNEEGESPPMPRMMGLWDSGTRS